MKLIRILIIVGAVMISYLSKAQCTVKASVSPTTICAGQSVFMKATGACNFLMNNNFNNYTLGVGWSSTAANPVFTNPCGPGPDSAHAWVGTTASQTRTLETVNYNVAIGGCKVDFWMRYGRVQGPSPCEDPDAANEGVHLQYSTNNGVTWLDFPGPAMNPIGINSTTGPFSTTNPGSGGYWQPLSSQTQQAASSLYYWHKYSCTVPLAATTATTKFRWAQLATSSTNYDAWGIDEVEIVCPDSNTIVEWTDPNGNVFSTQFIAGAIYPTVSGWYSITITDTFAQNFAKDSVYITVNPIPTPDFTVSDSSICQNDSILFTYTGNASPAANYDWKFDGTPVSGKGPHWEKYTTYGVFPVSLQVNDKGCQSSKKTINIQVNPKPLVSFYADVFQGCEPLTVNFTNATFPATSQFQWDFGDGGTSTQVDPTYTYTDDGVYTITLVANSNAGCSDSISIANLIKVHPMPDVNFVADKYLTSFKSPSFQLTNLSTNAFDCLWNFGDGNTDNTCDPGTYTFAGEGSYDICLKVTTDQGCADSTCRNFKVIVDEIEIPNVITPNGDGFNDYFVIENIEKLQEHNLMIYNRWGKKVFESANYASDWDGDNLADGVYYYVLSYRTMLGDEEKMEGTVTIMRKK